MTTDLKPTSEQCESIEAFSTGETLRINAYAGTGKTSTLSMLAKSTGKRGTYLAFNRSIADDAQKKFPSSVACSTQHSLAYRSWKGVYSSEKLTGSLSGGFLANKLHLCSYDVWPDMAIFPRGVGFLALSAIRRWCSSGRPELQSYDVPLDGVLATLSDGDKDGLRNHVISVSRKAWEQMIDKSSPIPLGHDGYLKLWAMGKPKIPGDFILLDEAQDSSGVILELMKHQSSQLIAVGDAHQQIYEWRGAVNAMKALPGSSESRLTTSFRFGTAIAGHATRILALLGETVPLRGNPEKASAIGECDDVTAILCRTNARLIEEVIGSVDRGQNPYVIGGVRELLDMIGAAEKLMDGKTVDYPLDFFGFKNWEEVRVHAEKTEGKDIRRIVRTIDEHGPAQLRSVLESLPRDEQMADVIYSTGHKAKGREWPEVRLCDDFLMGITTQEEQDAKRDAAEAKGEAYEAPDYAAELRLFYVASTRAMGTLEVPVVLMDKIRGMEIEPDPIPLPSPPVSHAGKHTRDE